MFSDDVGTEGFIQNRILTVSAHAPGVRALVVVKDGLVVLRRHQRQNRAAVGQDNKGDSSPTSVSSKTTLSPAAPKVRWRMNSSRVFSASSCV